MTSTRVANTKPETHYKCRNAKYPRTGINRLPVMDEQVSWDAEYQGGYNPEVFIDDCAKNMPWSDVEFSLIKSWNKRDEEKQIDRTSYTGTYVVDACGPRNPVGRTGIRGRGRLGRWGPNHAADPIVTRWKRDDKHHTVYQADKPILQFIAIQRKDTKEWAIPGGLVDPGENIMATLRREFGEEALNSLQADDKRSENCSRKIDKFFEGGEEIYRGYVDDPRNTDNSWIETLAVNFHDEDGTTLSRFKLQSGDEAVGVAWMDIDAKINLYASHTELIKQVVNIRHAYWHEKVTMHYKCRNATYPRSTVVRQTVTDEQVHWNVEYKDYHPVSHTDPGAIGKPWSDPEVSEIKSWNARDVERNIDRTSHVGKYVVDENGPRNPIGRTGIAGRGCLGRWGPNHAADPIVTRWKNNDPNQRILQFVAIQRRDTKEWAIPGGMVDPGEHVTVTLKREFGEEALNSLEADENEKSELQTRIDEFFRSGFEVYRGYVDDPRNTDNAWMETVAYNFHDEDGSTVARFELQSGDDAIGVRWMDMDSEIKLYASHVDMIRHVVDNHRALW